MSNKEVVGIYDADFIPYYVCHNKTDIPKTLEYCKELTDDFIRNVNNAIGATKFIGCLTVGKCFRYRVYPEYKANRKYKFDKEYQELMSGIKEYLITEYGCNYTKDELEADDLVRIFAKQLSTTFETVIVSPDKDILLLEGKHYNPKLNKWIITTKEEAEEYFWKSMITGDATDNIKGIPGMGKAAANKIFEGIKTPPARVLKYYIEHFGEEMGIEEYYKNYKCLRILDKYNIMFEPNIIDLNKEESESEERVSTKRREEHQEEW